MAVRPVTDGGYDALERAGQRQVDAVYSAVGQPTSNDPFITNGYEPTAARRAAQALGLGRNVDVYA
jgi:hypothetical protein